MKIPHQFFLLLNPMMRILLRSPVHSLVSNSLMLVTFTGRRSKRTFTTPVRYIRDGEIIRAFTAASNQWWRNMRGGTEVRLLIAGSEARYRAEAIDNAPDRVRAGLQDLLRVFPQDAPYYEIALRTDKQPDASTLERASRSTIMVEAEPLAGNEG